MIFSKLERRFGKVFIQPELLEENPDDFADFIFKGCIIIESKYDFCAGYIEYQFYCPQFEEVPLCCDMYEYTADITIEKDDDGEIVSKELKWRRVK